MNGHDYALLLWIIVAWPVLLAMPLVNIRLPKPLYLAIMPAVLVVMVPVGTTHVLPWVFFGTGLAVTSEVRWLLVMFAVIWLVAASKMKLSAGTPLEPGITTLFLLTLAGNLGVLLSADLVGFFCFSTLMGYSFYGLMRPGRDVATQRASRLYLTVLVVADLVIFEALLLAAATTKELQFAQVRQAMSESASSHLYLWMVIIGFALKAGIWPMQWWLSAAFRSGSRLSRLLLSGVPVAMAMLGFIRWLPLGMHSSVSAGRVMLVIGSVTLLYAVTQSYKSSVITNLPAWSTIAASGLFALMLGTGLTHPAVSREYLSLAYPYIAVIGVIPMLLAFFSDRHQRSRESRSMQGQQERRLPAWVAGWFETFQQWAAKAERRLADISPQVWMHAAQHAMNQLGMKMPIALRSSWRLAITTFVLIAVVLAWLAV